MKRMFFLLVGTLVWGAVAAAEPGVPEAAPATTPATAPAAANPSIASGLLGSLESASRVIKSFDFDEQKLGNFDSVPMYWNKVGGRGFPLFTGGQFDRKVGRSPVSFRLDLDGGSVAYQYTPGELKVNPNADYLVLGFVKTTALAHARAEMTAWFADGDDKILAATEAHSERWASADGKDDWHLLHLFISGNNPAVKSLVLQLGVLQPQQMATGAGGLGKYQIYEQDIKGSAWFDDVAVIELPRLGIKTTAVGGLFGPRKPAQVEMTVSDVVHAPLKVGLTVRDAAGAVADKEEWPVEPKPEEPWQKKVTLPPLAPGFYTATMEIGDAKGTLTRRQTRFACLGDLGETQPAADFGLDATGWPAEAWDELPTINGQIGSGLVKLPVWRKEMSEESLEGKDGAFDGLLNILQRQEVLCAASFAEVPSVLTGRVNEKVGDVMSLLETDATVWRPYVSFVLARYATRVEYWQVGSAAADGVGGAADPRLGRLFAKAKGELATMVSSPKMIVPWNALYEFDAKQFPGATVELLLPEVIGPKQIPAYIQSLTQNGTDVLAKIEPLDEAKYGRAERLNDFAQRVALARTTAAKGVLIDLPMTYTAELGGHSSEPTELLVVYRTLAQELGGATFKQELQLEQGVRALLFDRSGVGTLVLWNESGQHAQETVRIALGKNPQQVDLHGRVSPVVMEEEGVAALQAGAAPVIVGNIDTRLAELRAGFVLGQKVFPAGAGTVSTSVKLHNPYKEPLNGTLRLLLPTGWSADPPSMAFAISPGGDFTQAVTIRYPFTEYAGSKVIRGKLAVDGDAARSIDVLQEVNLASDVVEMECLAHFMPTGELVLLQTITNTSTQPLNAQAYALVPGMPRQQRFVLELAPSATVIKRFVFPNAAAASGKVAAAGIRQNDGTTLLTRSVPLN